MSDMLHFWDVVGCLILSAYGIVQFIIGMWREDYALATFGIALVILGKP